MADSYHDAERRILAALLLDWYREGDRLLGVEELHGLFGVTVEPRLFDGVIADLDRRGIVDAFYDKDGSSALLKPGGYKEAHAIVSREVGDPETFSVDWRKEEIVTEAPAADWFPMPEGWKWLELAPAAAPAVEPKRSPPAPREINWEKWGVVVAAIGILVSAALVLALHK